MQSQKQRVRAQWWPLNVGAEDGQDVSLEVEASEGGPGHMAIHTFVNGDGSESSYYLDRESALSLARDILKIIALD